MKNRTGQKPFDVKQYQAIATEIDERTLGYILVQIEKYLPKSHSKLNMLYYVVLRIAARMICLVSGDDPEGKERALAEFCETLPKIVREAKLIVVQAGNDTPQ